MIFWLNRNGKYGKPKTMKSSHLSLKPVAILIALNVNARFFLSEKLLMAG